MRRHSYGAGEVVFHEGDAADSVHFVLEGRVVARRSSEHGDRLAYAVMGPGQAFGELAMIVRGGRRTATIETVEPTVTLALRFADFERLCVRHPEVSRLLVRLLAARVNRLTEALMEALHTPAELRVVRSLVSLCGVYSTGAQGHSLVAVELNQTEIAELAGVTRPTANRVLRRLEAGGVVALDRGRVTVLDPVALRPRAPAGSSGTSPHGIPALSAGPAIGLSAGTPKENPAPNRKSDPSGRVIFLGSAVDEALEDAREAVRLLEVREVPAPSKSTTCAPGEDLVRPLRVTDRDHPVPGAPDDERRGSAPPPAGGP